MIKLIKLIVQLWIAASIVKAIVAANQQSHFEGYCEGCDKGEACSEDDEEPPYSRPAFRGVA